MRMDGGYSSRGALERAPSNGRSPRTTSNHRNELTESPTAPKIPRTKPPLPAEPDLEVMAALLEPGTPCRPRRSRWLRACRLRSARIKNRRGRRWPGASEGRRRLSYEPVTNDAAGAGPAPQASRRSPKQEAGGSRRQGREGGGPSRCARMVVTAAVGLSKMNPRTDVGGGRHHNTGSNSQQAPRPSKPLRTRPRLPAENAPGSKTSLRPSKK